MQRLSLDSSASKLHSYGGRKDDTYDLDDLKPASSSPSSSSSVADYDDHELKDFKPRRLSSLQFATTHQKREKLVHFIPILTLICFIILYLTSHAPSQSGSFLTSIVSVVLIFLVCFIVFWSVIRFRIFSDLAQFNGFMRPLKHLGTLQIRFNFISVSSTHIQLEFYWLIFFLSISFRIRRKWRRHIWIHQSRYTSHP